MVLIIFLFVSISEDDDYQTRFQEVETELKNSNIKRIRHSHSNTHYWTTLFALKTWFLRHTKRLRKIPPKNRLITFKKVL
ncbi:hypothetical protein BGS_0382 [Beggiatoa sp. SS]|nr:hypothetical protein BGS_0382 [Beggiatoa sp. SS]